MWKYQETDELYHHGILGMKWGHRKNNYSSTGIRSYIAKKRNEKIDKSFKDWQKKANNRDTAIKLGKETTLAKRQWENNKTSENKKAYKIAKHDYKKALNKNTTYHKGIVKSEVLKDSYRKHMSDAKKVKKILDANPDNKALQKQYNKLMSKHDIERDRSRSVVVKASNRSQAKANVKRVMTNTVKAAAATATIAGGLYATNKYLANHDVRLNGKPIRIGTRTVASLNKFVNIGKSIFKYI